MGGVHPVADLSERAQQREAPDRRVAAEVDLARRGEIAQVDAVRRKADKRRLRVLHLRGNGLHRPVRQLALRERDTGLISAEYPVGKRVHHINFHPRGPPVSFSSIIPAAQAVGKGNVDGGLLLWGFDLPSAAKIGRTCCPSILLITALVRAHQIPVMASMTSYSSELSVLCMASPSLMSTSTMLSPRAQTTRFVLPAASRCTAS